MVVQRRSATLFRFIAEIVPAGIAIMMAITSANMVR